MKSTLGLSFTIFCSICFMSVANAQSTEVERWALNMLDIYKADKFNLEKSCDEDTKVYSNTGQFHAGKTVCYTENIEYFTGSGELMFRVRNCQKDETKVEQTYFVLHPKSENEFLLISDGEVKQKLYVCN